MISTIIICLFSLNFLILLFTDKKELFKIIEDFFYLLLSLTITVFIIIITRFIPFIDDFFEIRFWFTYYFTNKYKNLDLDILKRCNDGVTKNSRKMKIRAVRKVNKLNDYYTTN